MGKPDVIAEILDLEATHAKADGLDVDSRPGPPASPKAITAAEKARGVRFPEPYRRFLATHDGWSHFAWGTSLYSTSQLTTKYDRGYIADMVANNDTLLTNEVRDAVVIGSSEDDASLVLLCPNGTIMDWRYEEQARFKDMDRYLAARAKTLREMLDEAQETEQTIERDWDPKKRAKAEAAVAKDVRKALTGAAFRPRVPSPKPPAKRPPAVRASSLFVKRGREVVAEVMLHLVLYLGAYPAKSEVIAAFRAWRKRFPVRGTLEWMRAGDMITTDSKNPDAEEFASELRVDNGHYGLRAQIDAKRDGRQARYILNVRGVPPTDDDDELPRASFCEVIIPASESHQALALLAHDLLAALPVRSGHAGFAAYIWDEDAEPDPNADIFGWCRRWFGIEIGSVDGWLPGALKRLRGASWLTVLGPAFADELDRAKRLSFRKQINVARTEQGVIIQAGPAPSLGDVQRGEFPVLVAEVERALAPLAMRHHDQRGWMSIGGNIFTTLVEDLLPFRSHRATAQYLDRMLDPQGFLAPTARERGEALLARLTTKGNAEYLREWKAEVKTGFPDFGALMTHLLNASCDRADTDAAIEALELAAQYEDEGEPASVYNALLYGHLQRFLKRKVPLDRALEVMPKALGFAKQNPAILHNAACVFARAGKLDRALACVLDAKKYRYKNMKLLLDDEDLVVLRDRPAFRKLRGAKPRA